MYSQEIEEGGRLMRRPHDPRISESPKAIRMETTIELNSKSDMVGPPSRRPTECWAADYRRCTKCFARR